MSITADTPLSLIKQTLSDKHREGREADLELARRVTCNKTSSVNYYIGEFSDGIVSYIKKAIYHGKDPRSDMYLVLSAPIKNSGVPGWHRVSLYQAYKGCSLQTYTRNISIRELIKIEKKEQSNNNATEFLDYMDYESLLRLEIATEEEYDVDESKMRKVRQAYSMLKERDKLAIQLLVIEKHTALDVFDQLAVFMHPKTAVGQSREEVIKKWNDKQKQDAVALIKGRAISKLVRFYSVIQ